MTEVYTITGNLPGHSHGGTASYIEYSHGCRHPDCLNAFNDYKLRLAARKLNGDFVDLRRRQHQLRAATNDYIGQRPAVTPGELWPGTGSESASSATVSAAEALSAALDPSGNPLHSQPVSGLTAADDRVLKYLQICLVPGGKGKVNAQMVGLMPSILRMPPEQIQAALDELEKAGLLAGDGTDLYLINAAT
jgi:hypothetical protein